MKGILKLIRLLVILCACLAIFVFCIKNQQTVDIHLYSIANQTMPLYMVMLGCFAMGVFLTSAYCMFEFLALSNRVRILSKQLKQGEKELQYLRNLPLDEGTNDTTEVDSYAYGQQEDSSVFAKDSQNYAKDNQPSYPVG